MKGSQLLAVDRAHDLRSTDHGAPERVLAEDGLAEQVEDLLLRIVLVHRDLLEHDLPLGLQFLQARAPEHVAHHIERPLQMAVEHACVERGRLPVGARVDLRAHRVEDLVDLLRSEALGAAEQHVLQQMRDPRLAVPLGRGAGADPEAERHRAHAQARAR